MHSWPGHTEPLDPHWRVRDRISGQATFLEPSDLSCFQDLGDMPRVTRRAIAVCRLEGLLPIDIPTRDNVSLNERRTLDELGHKSKYLLPCFFLKGK